MISFWKSPRGTYVLEREAKRSEARSTEKREKAAARKRDGKCRWPLKHFCRGGLESAHLRDASLGGEMIRSNLITLCAWLHRNGPESIHGKQLRIDAITSAGADGPCAFWQRLGNRWHLMAQERSVGVVERD